MAKKLGYTPVSIFAAICGTVATSVAYKNQYSAPIAAGIGTFVNSIVGGIELNEKERNIKEMLDNSIDGAWNKIDKNFKLSFYSENCLSELKDEIMGGGTSVDEVIRDIETIGFESSVTIVIKSILVKHREELDTNPRITWDDVYTENAAKKIASIIVGAIKNVFEEDDHLRILKSIAESEGRIINKIEDKGNQLIEALLPLKPTTVDFGSYYEDIKKEFTKIKDDDYAALIGDEPDKKAYIDAYITIGSKQVSVLEHLGEWFDNTKDRAILIYGEPGHGKSLLCEKAVFDFCNKKFLKDKANNVLAVSLNRPSIIENKEIRLANALGWGAENENKFSFKDCKGSLLFLDGFDEFIDATRQVNIHDICSFMGKVKEVANYYDMHIVVLSRKIAVSGDFEELKNICPYYEMSPVSEKQQNKWLDTHEEYDDYRETFNKLRNNVNMAELLGVPLLFRLIVHNRFGVISSNVVDLYDKLFSHLMNKRKIPSSKRNEIKNELMELAFKVYCTDADIVFLDEKDWDSDWIFAFYVKAPSRLKIGFFHSTFYQYFLAKYIHREILKVTDEKAAEDLIGSLAERELDDTVRDYLGKIDIKGKESEVHAGIEKMIDALVRTEAIIDSKPSIKSEGAEKSRILRSTNIYRNTLHIAAAFSYVIQIPIKGNLDVIMKTFNSSEIVLISKDDMKADMRGANLKGATLTRAKLKEACLEGTILYFATLFGADLEGADLEGAHLERADLERAYLKGSHLEGAYLERAYLGQAILEKAHLEGADLEGAHLERTNLFGAHLERTILKGAHLEEAHLEGGHLGGVHLEKANLEGAHLEGAHLEGGHLEGAHLEKADLERAHLEGARLGGAHLEGAHLEGAFLERADLSGANLTEAKIDIKYKGIIDPTTKGYDFIEWVTEAEQVV